jgi:hypothetical protein
MQRGVRRDWSYPRSSNGFRSDFESQGDKINTMMAREQSKQATLRARLKDLGFTQAEVDKCFVEAANDPNFDTVTIPWSVAYRAFNTSDGFAMGVQS